MNKTLHNCLVFQFTVTCGLKSFWPNAAMWVFAWLFRVECSLKQNSAKLQDTKKGKDSRFCASLCTHLIFSVNGEDSVSLVQEFTGICNVNCCFLFVSCQHPDFYPSFSKSRNSVRHSTLQPIFNPCCSWANRKTSELVFFHLEIMLLFFFLRKGLWLPVVILNLSRAEPRYCPANKHRATRSAFGLRSEFVSNQVLALHFTRC